jgi:hypothetical protein
MTNNNKIINCANLIRKDCQIWYEDKKFFSIEDLHNRENFIAARIQQYLEQNSGPFTVFIGLNSFIWLVPILKAVWRAGGNIFVHDFHYGYTSMPEFKDFYNFINIVINPETPSEFFNDNKFLINISDYCPKQQYESLIFENVSIHDNTVAVKTHSSGTTGIPKIIDYTHKTVYNLTKRLIKLFQFSPSDRPFHYKTLHHSSLFLNYAMPLLHLCQNHWCTQFKNNISFDPKYYFDRVLPLCKQLNLTRILVPYDWISKIDQVSATDLNYVTNIHVIRGTSTAKLAYIFNYIKPKTIVDIFGCSEIGVMFIKTINKENYKKFVPGEFSEIVPDLEYQIHPTFIKARWPEESWRDIGDIFEEKNNKLIYIGRSWSIIVDGKIVPLEPLSNYLNQKFKNREYQLIPDLKKNHIYLAIFDDYELPLLSQLNNDLHEFVDKKLCIRAIKKFDITKVQTGMKPSTPILLYAFAKEFDNE